MHCLIWPLQQIGEVGVCVMIPPFQAIRLSVFSPSASNMLNSSLQSMENKGDLEII